MPDVPDVDAVNQSVAEHVAELRESLERGRLEIERQKQALQEIAQPEGEAAA